MKGLEFLSVNRELMRRAEKEAGRLAGAVRRIESLTRELVAQFRKAIFAGGHIAEGRPVLGTAVKRATFLGVHAFMFHDVRLLDRALESSPSEHEKELSDLLGFKHTEDMRACLRYVFETLGVKQVLSFESSNLDATRECEAYMKLGMAQPHLGLILRENPDIPGSPRAVSINPLVPWILRAIVNFARGDIGAGYIASVEASIGRGKTTTTYYTIRSVLNLLGHPDPDGATQRLIILDPVEFIEVSESLAERREKVALSVVDNASIILPKQWASYGGELRKFFLRANTMVSVIRGLCAVNIFVANAPGELASFVRNATIVRFEGEALDQDSLLVTAYVLRRAGIRVTASTGEEKLIKKERLATVYVYPFLKLPEPLYYKDITAKLETVRKELKEAEKIAKLYWRR